MSKQQQAEIYSNPAAAQTRGIDFDDISLPEVCISSNTNSVKEEINYEVQQAYRIFSEFLTEKHKVMTSPFWNPTVNQDEETQCGSGGVCNRYPVNVRQSMCLHRMEEKFIHQEYETITEFVADFRLMLENCYRYHGVDHWLSKQAQKLEIMLEQKLTLLSRKLREKTTLVVTSKGRFGVGEEPPSSSSTRRRHTRSIKTLTVGGHESIMVQTLRVEEQQRAREEKKWRELEKKEAEEISAKEMDEWEQNLLSQAFPHNVETLWELPAIGHFLCLAQSALNLPEIVFFELERCLLMPRCSILLSKIMSSLLCQPQRRSTLHRRPVLPYRRWESELRQRVRTWFQSVGSSHDQTARAEHLGLCHQFFSVLGKSSPLEAKAFHMLPFYQRVWLLKGLCDHVYETQRDIQMAVLAQPIHECRESILGYDSKENAYIHFPHFCGADLRIYRQSPSAPPNFPFPSVLVEKVELLHRLEEEMPSVTKSSSDVYRDSFDDKTVKEELYKTYKVETIETDVDRCRSWRPKPREHIQISNDEDSGDECKVEPHTNSSPIKGLIRKHILTEEKSDTKRKMSLWYGRRESVKDLHSTLIRLLNELTPWEPKLIKAHQRNRYKDNVIYIDLSSLFTLSGTVKDLSTELSADVPVTHKSHNCPKQLLSGNLDYSLKNTNRSELNHQSSDSFSSQKQTIPLSKPSVLHSVSGQPKSYTPIPTLLAKSVGNKVTLMKQPADHLEIDSKGTVVSTGDTNLSKLNNCSSGPPQNSSQKQVSYTVHKEQNPLVGTSSSNLKCKEMEPQQVVFLNPNILHSTDKEVTLSQQQSKDIISSEIDSTLCTSTNVAGFTIPESGTLVQQVPPSKNTGLTEASVCSSNIHSFFRSQPSAISNASAPQCSLHDITAPLSISKSTDSKQELKTVCIRESQSILVTTRGGNTGIVKVQKSTDHTVGFSKGPVITISPQFQALLVSKTSSVFSPNTGQSGSVSTASTGPTVQTGPETPSVSLNQEVSKYSSTTKTQGLTGSSVYTSTSNCVTTTAQTVFTNSNGISTAPAPATSRSSLKHLGFSSITVNSQPRNVTCPSTKSLSADISKNLMWSSNSKVHPATSQTTPSPISALSLKHKPLFVSNATGHFDKTSLSPPLCFPRPEDSSDMPRSTEVPDIAKGLLTKPTTTSSQTSLTNSVQRQIVINTSTRLAGGTRIVLNNAHFVVPPQGLGPGSHVLVISGHAPQVPGSSVKTEETVPLQGVNKGQVLLQPSFLSEATGPDLTTFLKLPKSVRPILFSPDAPGSEYALVKPGDPDLVPCCRRSLMITTNREAIVNLSSIKLQSYSKYFVAVPLFKVPASQKKKSSQDDDQQSDAYSPDRDNIIKKIKKIRTTDRQTSTQRNKTDVLLSSDESSSATGKIDVEISTRHPVRAVTPHQVWKRESQHHSNISKHLQSCSVLSRLN
uniref:Bromo domain-containing protein n=1 Tax=Periophthalmus magnuspinnatus TaxID=409849 RepID=A0A3B4A9L1_9GOBI